MWRHHHLVASVVVIFSCLVLSAHSNEMHYVNLLQAPANKMAQIQELQSNMEEIESPIDLHQLSALDMTKIGATAQRILGKFDAIGENYTVSQKCLNDTAYFMVNIRENWALRMIDAFGKPGPGLLNFQLLWVGDYEECVQIHVTDGATDTSKSSFDGQYCTAVLPLTPTVTQPGSPTLSFGVNLGVCVPNSCSKDDLIFLLNSALDDLQAANLLNITFRFNYDVSNCQNEDLEYSTKAIAAIVIGSIFAAIIVMGTLYDLLSIQLPKYLMSSGIEDEDAAVNSKLENGDSMNIKYRSDETAPLLGDKKALVEFEAPQPGLCGRLLLCFSAYSNGLKILSTKQPKGSLKAVHGIRFLSMTWVIMGHTLVFGISTVANFTTFFAPLLKGFAFQAISNATVSVDTFFTLSGLLVGYLTLKEMKKKSGSINWAMFYFHRYWRLTPPYMFLMLLYVPLFPYITTGPLWQQKGVEINECSNSWWTNLLYVNNLVKTKEMCMGWSWYLANDMQFYILSPLILIPLYYNRILGFIVSLIFLLTTLITAGSLSSYYHMSPGLAVQNTAGGNGTAMGFGGADQSHYFFDYYIPTYCRMGPYIIGLLAGYYIYSTELKVRWNKITVILGWCIATASALAILYGLYGVAQGHPISNDTAAFYNAVHRTVWGACVCWVVIACAAGYGGPVDVILSWKAFVPLSRLTYCCYLIHPIIMYAYFLGQKQAMYFTTSTFVFLFFAFLVAAHFLAFVLSLMFESPMMGLEAIIFKRQKR